MVRLVNTSAGTFVFEFWHGAPVVTVWLLDEEGWSRSERSLGADDEDWGERDLVAVLVDEGVPGPEAEGISRQVLAAREERDVAAPPDEPLPLLKDLAVIVPTILATLGVWLVGLAFLGWIVVTSIF